MTTQNLFDFEDCIIKIISVATSMEDSLPITLLHTDTEIGVERSLFQSIVAVKIKTKDPSLFWIEQKSLCKSLYLLNSPSVVK